MSGLNALDQMSRVCGVDTLKSNFARVHSYLTYVLCVYEATIKSNLDPILKLQTGALCK